jgi:hypothetical protein
MLGREIPAPIRLAAPLYDRLSRLQLVEKP